MAINPETLRLIARMRAELGSIVDDTVRITVAAWVDAWDEIAGAWDAALTELATARADGRWPTQTQVYRYERTTKALDVTSELIADLAEQAGIRVTDALPGLTEVAAEWEARLTAAQMPPTAGTQAVLTAQFNRVDPLALNAIVTRTTQQVTALILPLSAEATAAMHATLVRGIALGDNPLEAARRMLRRVEGDFNGGLTRALTIARTEMLDAHRAASHAQDTANADVLAGWQWMASLDVTTCPSCLAMHGTVHPIDTPGPEDHQNGRCARLPKTKTWAELGFTGIEEPADLLTNAQAWFDGLTPAEQLQIMGPARLELLQSGQIGWDDLSTRRSTPGWRDAQTVTPVRDLRDLAAA